MSNAINRGKINRTPPVNGGRATEQRTKKGPVKSVPSCSAKNSLFCVFTEKKDELKTGAGKESIICCRAARLLGFLCFVRVCCSSVLLPSLHVSPDAALVFGLSRNLWKLGLKLRERFCAAVVV